MLRDRIRDLITELDPDGAGFRTREAADRLVHDLVSEGLPAGFVDQPTPRYPPSAALQAGAHAAARCPPWLPSPPAACTPRLGPARRPFALPMPSESAGDKIPR